MKREEMGSCGLIFLYLAGQKEENGGLMLRKVDSCQDILDFSGQVRVLQEEVSDGADIELFCILGRSERVEKIFSVIDRQIQDNFQRILKEEEIELENEELDFFAREFSVLIQEHIFCGEYVRYPRSCVWSFGEWELAGFWAGLGPEDEGHLLADSAVSLWMSYEKPMLFGKQMMIQSFELRDLSGRKILGAVPEPDSGQWYLLLEGGRKLRLGEEVPYIGERAGMRDFGDATVTAVDTIINNPVYAYGELYEPQELFEEWHKVFLYLLALSDKEWTSENIAPVYEKFLDFVKEHICLCHKVPAFLEKGMFAECLAINVENLRGFLKGREEPVVSKELLKLLNSRYVYIPYLWEALKKELPGAVCERQIPEFAPERLKKYLCSAEEGTAYEKGVRWEKAAEYYVQQICGLRITGKRVKTGFQEIDLSAVNVSLDSRLWEMGSYILIECKNWSEKAGIEVIRTLVHICAYKGNKTAFYLLQMALHKTPVRR